MKIKWQQKAHVCFYQFRQRQCHFFRRHRRRDQDQGCCHQRFMQYCFVSTDNISRLTFFVLRHRYCCVWFSYHLSITVFILWSTIFCHNYKKEEHKKKRELKDDKKSKNKKKQKTKRNTYIHTQNSFLTSSKIEYPKNLFPPLTLFAY